MNLLDFLRGRRRKTPEQEHAKSELKRILSGCGDQVHSLITLTEPMFSRLSNEGPYPDMWKELDDILSLTRSCVAEEEKIKPLVNVLFASSRYKDTALRLANSLAPCISTHLGVVPYVISRKTSIAEKRSIETVIGYLKLAHRGLEKGKEYVNALKSLVESA